MFLTYIADQPCSVTIQNCSPRRPLPTGVWRGRPLRRPVVSRIAVWLEGSRPRLTSGRTTGLTRRLVTKRLTVRLAARHPPGSERAIAAQHDAPGPRTVA